MPEGSSVPETVAATGRVSWDLGPGAEGHRGVQPYYLPMLCTHCPPALPSSSAGIPEPPLS